MPGKEWEWEDIWYVEKVADVTDDEGWQYAVDFKGPFHKQQGLIDVIRRRKWIRVCKQKAPEGDNNTHNKTGVSPNKK